MNTPASLCRRVLSVLMLLTCCAMFLNACVTSNTTTLHALHPIRQQALALDFAEIREIIVLMPVQLAPQIQGRGLLVQEQPGEARSSASHLWAGPLEQQIGQHIVATLKDLLATDNVTLYPGPRFAATRYQLEVEMTEFSGDRHTFTTVAVWTLSDSINKNILARKTSRQTRAINEAGYSGMVATASQNIVELSREMATALLAAQRTHVHR